jgi:cell division protein FtsW
MAYSRIDRTLLLTVLVLILLGSIFVFSSSYYQAMRKGEDTMFYLKGHLKRVGVAVFFLLLGLFLPHERIRKLLFPLLIILVIALVSTLVLGRAQYGARRSLLFSSFGLQISEFVRIWIVIFLANFFATHPDTANDQRGIATAIFIPLLLIVLVAVQPSISIALISFATLVAMFVYGGAKVKHLAPIVLGGTALFIVFALVFPHVRYRLFSFAVQPTYQVQQSLLAIGSGGIFGRGLGAGLQKFLFLPRIHNDFIFAHIAEEIGFVGSFIIFLLYWEVFLRGVSIAHELENTFPKLLAFGLTASIFMIFLVHVGVSIGLLPPTGIPLPFISYGGWSLCANLFAVGMVLQVSRMR